MPTTLWMVRAGEGGYLLHAFLKEKVVAVGWGALTDLSAASTLDLIRQAVAKGYPDQKPGAQALSAGMLNKFVNVMAVGDRVVTYDPAERRYHLGTIKSPYRYVPNRVADSAHLREVTWDSAIPRDALSATARNTLGSVLTVFAPGEAVLEELLAGGRQESGATPEDPAELAAERTELLKSIGEQSRQHIEDMLLALDETELPDLVCAILRAMGFRARLGSKGSDRGRDVLASPDGLGLQSPRIFVEVKARANERIGAPLIRSFIAALKETDRGLYVATGGFSKEAHYEADRSAIPVTLIGVSDLAALVVEHYDKFDTEGRELVPLQRVYWPRG